jgi:type II secretory pathway component PulF
MAAGALAILGIIGRVAVMQFFQGMMRKLPIMRDVVVAQESARFFSVMGAMTRSGVPIADALAVANQALTHPVMRRQLERMRTRLIEGGLMRTLIDEVLSLPIATRRLLIAAERSGDLENAFQTLAGDMSDEVERSSSRLLAVLEPALIVFMFLIIGSVLLALMLPMLTLSSKIQF